MAVNDNADKKGQELSFELRRALGNAYAFVKGRESVQSFSAFTFEDAMDQQIERIEGKGTELRPNELDRITKIENEILQAVNKIKELPPEAFIEPDVENDVNTPPEVEAED